MFPSPIQCRAIPLAKSGHDLFVQAKSGTGKTLVFAVTILDRYLQSGVESKLTTVILAPTREIAVQIQSVIKELAERIKGFKVLSCIGGTDVEQDRKRLAGVSCLVGTPGRVLHLIRNKYINTSQIELLVLDEADKLMSDGFKKDVVSIAEELNQRQQTLVVSATFDAEIEKSLYPLMKNPLGVTPKKEAPVLHGISQFIFLLSKAENIMEEMRMKVDKLDKLLREIDYNQCLVFTNSQSRAESYSNMLFEKGFIADYITGAQDQNTRLRTFERIMVAPNCRLIITTDLLARGIDAERVNVVINLELPPDQFCYLHRIGRAGRFGSLGIAISFVSEGEELMKFKNILLSDEFPVYRMTLENAKDTNETLETGKVPESFQVFLAPEKAPPAADLEDPTVDLEKENLKQVERKEDEASTSKASADAPAAVSSEPREEIDLRKDPMKLFEVYDKVIKGELTLENMPICKPFFEDEESNVEVREAVKLITRDILDQKLDLEQTVASSNEPMEGSSGYKRNLEDSFSEPDSKGMFSTTTNLDSDSTQDNIGDSEINEALQPGNLNTESVNEKVDAFLDQLQENGEASEPSILEAAAPETATINGDISEALETVQEAANQHAAIHLEALATDSGSQTDDEESSSSSDHDSNASIRGSDSFANAIGDSDEEEDYFGTEATPASAAHTQNYHLAYNTWTNIYWNQATQIKDYVNYVRYVRQAAASRHF